MFVTCKPDSPIKHKHHITPRYRGGSDDSSNLVEVSIVQHAMWHFCNYQLWRDDRDKVAWVGLSSSVGKEDVIKSLQALGIKASKTSEAIAKKKETMKRNRHQQGEKNSQFGKRWIHSMSLRVSKRIMKKDKLPDGWNEGRVINFDKKLNPTPKAVRKKPRLGIPRDWIHDVYGVILDNTSSELCEKYKDQKLDKGALSQVALGRNKNHKGWRIFNNKNTRG